MEHTSINSNMRYAPRILPMVFVFNLTTAITPNYSGYTGMTERMQIFSSWQQLEETSLSKKLTYREKPDLTSTILRYPTKKVKVKIIKTIKYGGNAIYKSNKKVENASNRA